LPEEEYESDSESDEEEEIDEKPKRTALVDIEDEDEILHKSYLYKLYFTQWKKRYFVLLKNGKLYKYRSHKVSFFYCIHPSPIHPSIHHRSIIEYSVYHDSLIQKEG
jgi:hypothetical protein